jgi:hypothetical protein
MNRPPIDEVARAYRLRSSVSSLNSRVVVTSHELPPLAGIADKHLELRAADRPPTRSDERPFARPRWHGHGLLEHEGVISQRSG